MNRILLLTVCLVSMTTRMAQAQSLGTIKLNEHYSATCEFDENIKGIYISNNEMIRTISSQDGIQEQTTRLYDYIIDGKTVIFSTYKQLPSKSVTIKLTDGSTWYGILEYDQQDKNIFYRFNGQPTKKKDKKEIEDSLSIIKNRLNVCLSKKSHFASFGINKNKIYWDVSNIMADDDMTYIKIVVNNRSGHEYKITNGKPLFKYIEGKSNNLKRKEASVKVDGQITTQQATDKINAYSTEVLGYVIKSYPLNTNGKLVISFLELNGKRNYEIRIPFKKLQEIEVFND